METNFCCRGLESVNEDKVRKDILTLLSQNPNEELGRYNREIVKKYYSIEKMTDDCEKAYKKTLEKKNI